MVRFQYDHNIGQWRWHISKNAEKLDEKILDALRGAIGGNAFTYASVGGEDFVCMSSVPADGGSILQGTVVGVKGKLGVLPEKPSCYVGKWGKYDLLSTEDIPEGELPEPDTSVDYDYFPEQLGTILDAVMFGSRKVAVIVASNDEAMDCIKAINYMLPPAYAKRIGYSVGAEKIPDTNISVMTDSGKSLPINVKVFFTTADKLSSSAQGYYIFDIDPNEPTNNYKAELSEFAKVVGDFCLDSKTNMDVLAKHIAPAFDENGNLDKDVLKRLSLHFRFVNAPDDKTAEGLVEAGMGNGTDKVQKNAFMSACRHFWGHGDPLALPAEKRQKMVEAYNCEMGSFVEKDSVDYLRYLLSQNMLTEAEHTALHDIAVTRGCLAQEYDALFCNPEFSARNTVFGLVTELLKKDSNIYSCEELVKGAVEYFDIANCFAVLAGNGENEKGEELFSLAAKVQEKEVKTLLAAILMTSCYTTTASAYSPHTPVRFRGLRRFMSEQGMNPIEQLACTVKVQRAMGDIANLGDIDVNDISYFLCDKGNGNVTPEWTTWIKEAVGTLSMSQLIDMESVLINSDYIGLKEIVESKLLDIDYVAPQLRSHVEVRPEYVKIFSMLNNDNQYRNIAEYLKQLKNEGMVEERFLARRWDFLKDAYDTLSDSDKRKIGDMKKDAAEHKTDKRNDLANRVQAEFRGRTTGGGNQLIWLIIPYVNTVVWAGAAFVLMMILSNIVGGIMMTGHSSIVSDFMVLPIVAAISSALLFIFNDGRNIFRRNIVTAIETVVFTAAMLIAFYGSIGILGLIIR